MKCLERQRKKLGKDCYDVVFNFEKEEAADPISVDASFSDACKSDADNLCSNVPSALVESCLRRKRKKLSSTCQESLFTREKIEVGDVNLQAGLTTKCSQEISNFCSMTSSENDDTLIC